MQVAQREAEVKAAAEEMAAWRAGLRDLERRATAGADDKADAIVRVQPPELGSRHHC